MFAVKESDKLKSAHLAGVSKGAYSFLIQNFGTFLGDSADLEAIAVAAWAFVHGLATLELKGQLDLPHEETKEEHMKFLDDVLQTFVERFARTAFKWLIL